jgi:hypothetical protein
MCAGLYGAVACAVHTEERNRPLRSIDRGGFFQRITTQLIYDLMPPYRHKSCAKSSFCDVLIVGEILNHDAIKG